MNEVVSIMQNITPNIIQPNIIAKSDHVMCWIKCNNILLYVINVKKYTTNARTKDSLSHVSPDTSG